MELGELELITIDEHELMWILLNMDYNGQKSTKWDVVDENGEDLTGPKLF